MPNDKIHDGITDLEHALTYCQKNFISCSEQRLSTFRYFIIYIAALAYGFYEIHEHEQHLNLYVIFILLISLVISFAFYKLESRNREILSISESGCKEIETLLSNVLKDELLIEVESAVTQLNNDITNNSEKSRLNKIKQSIEKFDSDKIKIMTLCGITRSSCFFNSYKNSIKLVFLSVFSLHIIMLLTVILCKYYSDKDSWVNEWICPQKHKGFEKKEYIFIESEKKS